jgi:AcrR family transcriptional regulator/DNA-binding MarR family transcriptional regulator
MYATGGAPSGEIASRRLNHTHGAGREQVTEIQRRRMLDAMVRVACERGAVSPTVADVVGRAGVSRRTFYEVFESCESCLLAALDYALEYAAGPVVTAYRMEGGWHERVRASLLALLRFCEGEPHMARLLVVESLGAGPQALERRVRVLKTLIAAVDEGRTEGKARPGLTPLVAEGVVGAVLGIVHGRLLQGSQQRLPELLNPLMSMVVLPYLGPAAAQREMCRPMPAHASTHAPVDPGYADASSSADPFKAAGMRVTYRTMRTLCAIAARPGSSNRQLGEATEVGDQGQMSKLLARLERIGLIANRGGGYVRGEPNAWSLTPTGHRVIHTVNANVEERREHEQRNSGQMGRRPIQPSPRWEGLDNDR